MKIVQINHKFTRTPSARKVTEAIVIHHSASKDVSSQTIHSWHLNNRWIGIGYHYVVRSDGTIETGRQMGAVGTHALSPANEKTIGICVTGDFDSAGQAPTKQQMDSLTWLIREHLVHHYGQLPITFHKDWANTACPGRAFPVTELLDRVYSPKVIVNNKTSRLPTKMGRDNLSYVYMLGEDNKKYWIQVRSINEVVNGVLSWDQTTETATIKT